MRNALLFDSMASTKRVAARLRLFVALALTALVLSGCSSMNSINKAINNYQQVASQVKLGQSKDDVLALLLPTQANLSPRQSKPFEQFREGEVLKEIYFFRTRSFSDGLVTDDEFTPYVFEDGVLTAIGWTAIGGPKTQAQQRESDFRTSVHGYWVF